MKTNNTMTPLAFALEHVFWGALLLYLYKCLLFCPLGRSTAHQSQLILVLLLASCSLVGGLSHIQAQRNERSVFIDLMLGLGIYTVLAYGPVRPCLIRVVLILVSVLSAVYALLALARKYKPGPVSVKRRIFSRRIRCVVAVTQMLFAMGFTVILTVIVSPLMIGNVVLSASTPAEGPGSQEQTIAGNMDTLLLLQEEQWQGLTVEQRLKVLQTAANIERCYLGLPHELYVGLAPTNENTYGFYVDSTHEIVISMTSVLHDPPEDLLNIVCHEAYHGYQHCLVDVYETLDTQTRELKLFQQTAAYQTEFQNYTDGEDDFESYYRQACESDARAYATDAVRDYYSRIEEYLFWQEPSQ